MCGPGKPYEGLVRDGEWTGKTRLVEGVLDAPLHWRRPRTILVASMGDLFHESRSDEDIDRVFAVMALASWHKFLVLTKRAERMRVYASGEARYRIEVVARRVHVEHCRACQDSDEQGVPRPHLNHVILPWPLSIVRLGVSVEDQATADARIPLLLQTPAACRWVSVEPMLGPIDLCHLQPGDPPTEIDALHGTHGVLRPHGGECEHLDHVVTGGESGPHARPCDVAWVRDVVRECREAAVPCFVKQLGRWIAGDWPTTPEGHLYVDRWLFPDGAIWVPGVIGEHNYLRPEGAIAFQLRDRAGADPAEWPEDLRVRELPA